MSIINNMPKSPGMEINGLIEEYYVYAGQEISAGDFVEFVNGYAKEANYGTSSIVSISATYRHASNLAAVALDNNRVFMIHGVPQYTTSDVNRTLVGYIVTVEGASFTWSTRTTVIAAGNYTQGVDPKLLKIDDTHIILYYVKSNSTSTSYFYYYIVTIDGDTFTSAGAYSLGSTTYDITSPGDIAKLHSGKYFMTQQYSWEASSGTAKYCLRAKVLTLSSNYTFSSGSTTIINSGEGAGRYTAVSGLQNDTSTEGTACIFYGGSDASPMLTTVVCILSGTTFTIKNTSAISTDTLASPGSIHGAMPLSNNRIWVTGQRSSGSPYCYSIIYQITNESTVSNGTLVTYGSTFSTVYYDYSRLLQDGRGLVTCGYHSYTVGMGIVTFSGLVNSVKFTNLNSYMDYLEQGIAGVEVTEGQLLMLWGQPYNNGSLYGQVFAEYSETGVINNNIDLSIKETQVRLATSENPNGVAKTNGTGGTTTAHKDTVLIFVPDV